MPFTFPGYRVRLRPIRLDDVDAMMAWINDPEVTRNFANLGREITREEELAWLEAMIASETDRVFAVEDEGGTYLGNVGVHRIYWPARNGRLGIVLGAPQARGRGYGQEALRLICALGFQELGLHKLWVVHYATNERMRHIVGKLGFVCEGVLREEYLHEGTFHDMVRHSLLEHEYRERAASWGVP